MKWLELKPVFCDPYIPNRDLLEEGNLYISMEYASSSHLCACGCKSLVVLPFKKNQEAPMYWGFINDNGSVTFTPSIGNWQLPCRSHYNITSNKIIWHKD